MISRAPRRAMSPTPRPGPGRRRTRRRSRRGCAHWAILEQTRAWAPSKLAGLIRNLRPLSSTPQVGHDPGQSSERLLGSVTFGSRRPRAERRFRAAYGGAVPCLARSQAEPAPLTVKGAERSFAARLGNNRHVQDQRDPRPQDISGLEPLTVSLRRLVLRPLRAGGGRLPLLRDRAREARARAPSRTDPSSAASNPLCGGS